MAMSILDSLRILPEFAASFHKITKKLGGVGNLIYLPLQCRLHAICERLMEERGEIRLVVVKPRQIRSSTYCQSLIHEQMYDQPGTQALTITHRGSVTDELFATMKRFQDYMPEDVKIPSKKDNEEVLYLSNESKAKVATAGSDGARGFPCRILQWSEVGRCTGKQVRDVQEGAMQTLATGYGTIAIEESTSGGAGNYFHEKAMQGRDPKERWRTAFFAWFEEPEYRIDPPKGWEPDEEERQLAKMFNLDWAQLYWRHSKIKSEFLGSVKAFNREYPSTFEMAFEAAGGKLIDYMAILKARKNILVTPDPLAPVVMGVDPAGKGDRTVIVIRQGNVIVKHWVYRTMEDSTLTGIVNRLMENWLVHTCFIDMGYGHATVSHLRDMGRFNVIGIHFGGSASQPHLFGNKRAEMAYDLKVWMHQGVDDQGGLVKIPDDDEFCTDFTVIPDLEFKGSKGLFYLPPKEEIKDDLGKSTDIFDASILTFAFPVKSDKQRIITPASVGQTSLLQTEQTFAKLHGAGSQDIINPNFKYYTFGGMS